MGARALWVPLCRCAPLTLRHTHNLTSGSPTVAALVAGQYIPLTENRRHDICIGAAICDRFQTVHYVNKGAVGGERFGLAGWRCALQDRAGPPRPHCLPLPRHAAPC